MANSFGGFGTGLDSNFYADPMKSDLVLVLDAEHPKFKCMRCSSTWGLGKRLPFYGLNLLKCLHLVFFKLFASCPPIDFLTDGGSGQVVCGGPGSDDEATGEEVIS